MYRVWIVWPFKITTCLVFFLAGSTGGLFAQKASPLFEVTATKYLLGTKVDITASHANITECKNGCYYAFKEIERIEKLLSSHKNASEISKINNQAGQYPVKVSYETFSIIKRALAYSKKFNGYFDISIGPLTELWGFNGNDEIVVPDEKKLNTLKSLVDYTKITLNSRDTTVSFDVNGMRIDLGGIAKGYAVDRAAKVLQEQGIQHFLINAGGDIYASGNKSENMKWRVGIQHPRKSDALLAKLELKDFAVATSGDYERFVMIDGQRYHHILNPETGYPANLCQSVSVFAPTVEEADAWATYLFIVGFRYYKTINEHRPINSIFVDSSGEIHFDRSLQKDFLLTVMN